MENLKPSLNQITNFRHYAEQDEHLKIFDWNNNRLDEMTYKQFAYVKHLWTERNYMKMKEILSNFLTTKQ
jgi:hypothetical protein